MHDAKDKRSLIFLEHVIHLRRQCCQNSSLHVTVWGQLLRVNVIVAIPSDRVLTYLLILCKLTSFIILLL